MASLLADTSLDDIASAVSHHRYMLCVFITD